MFLSGNRVEEPVWLQCRGTCVAFHFTFHWWNSPCDQSPVLHREETGAWEALATSQRASDHKMIMTLRVKSTRSNLGCLWWARSLTPVIWNCCDPSALWFTLRMGWITPLSSWNLPSKPVTVRGAPGPAQVPKLSQVIHTKATIFRKFDAS